MYQDTTSVEVLSRQKIAARSLKKGSNVGEGTPKIADVGSEEAPGDKLMDMSMGSKMRSMDTSGSIDFTKSGNE